MELLGALLVLGLLAFIASRMFGCAVRAAATMLGLLAVAGLGAVLFFGGGLGVFGSGSGTPAPEVTVEPNPDGGWDVSVEPVSWAKRYRIELDGVKVGSTTGGTVLVDDPPLAGKDYLPGPVRKFEVTARNGRQRETTVVRTCSPVLFLSVRGTDENHPKIQFAHGVGSRGWRTWAALQNQLGVKVNRSGVRSSLIGAVGVKYPAEFADYSAGRNKGKRDLIKKINQVAKRCPDSAVVLFGYSQGADIVNSVWHVAGSDVWESDRADRDQILGVVSFADPHFDRVWAEQGVAYPQGAVFKHNGVLGARGPFDDDEIDVVQAWCSPKDLVCQGGGLPNKKYFHGDEYDVYEQWAAYYLAKDLEPWLRERGWTVSSPTEPAQQPSTSGR